MEINTILGHSLTGRNIMIAENLLDRVGVSGFQCFDNHSVSFDHFPRRVNFYPVSIEQEFRYALAGAFAEFHHKTVVDT